MCHRIYMTQTATQTSRVVARWKEMNLADSISWLATSGARTNIGSGQLAGLGLRHGQRTLEGRRDGRIETYVMGEQSSQA